MCKHTKVNRKSRVYLYKDRVENDRKCFEIPALLSCEWESPESGKIQNNIYVLNFPTPFSAEFSRSQDKRVGISKNFMSFSTLFLYIPWLSEIISTTSSKFNGLTSIDDAGTAFCNTNSTNPISKKILEMVCILVICIFQIVIVGRSRS